MSKSGNTKTKRGIDTTPYPIDSPRNKELNQLVIDMVLGCDIPFSVVDHPKFIQLLLEFDPRFVPK